MSGAELGGTPARPCQMLEPCLLLAEPGTSTLKARPGKSAQATLGPKGMGLVTLAFGGLGTTVGDMSVEETPMILCAHSTDEQW